MTDDKIHRQRKRHVDYNLLKYQVFWQPQRSDFLYSLKKYFSVLQFYLQCPVSLCFIIDSSNFITNKILLL